MLKRGSKFTYEGRTYKCHRVDVVTSRWGDTVYIETTAGTQIMVPVRDYEMRVQHAVRA